jgi:hypothetical protein
MTVVVSSKRVSNPVKVVLSTVTFNDGSVLTHYVDHSPWLHPGDSLELKHTIHIKKTVAQEAQSRGYFSWLRWLFTGK